MVDLTALRATTYSQTARPWGRDFRPAGLNDVQVTTPGAPSVLTARFRLADLGPFATLSGLGVLTGAIAAAAIAAWLDYTGWYLLLLLVVGMLTGWYLLGRLVARVLSIQAHARLALTDDTPLTIVVSRVAELPEAQRGLIELLEDAGVHFLDSDGELDEAFMLAVTHTIEALANPSDDARTAIARRHLENLVRPTNDDERP
jgi:hypothetical protein